jgi:prolipoprotein diacylglyceryltransferase
MSDGPEWFAPKRYGYGAGMPISWQGWALTIGFILSTVLLAKTLGRHPAQMVAAIVPLIVIFIVISARTTRGGWHWRWGEKD